MRKEILRFATTKRDGREIPFQIYQAEHIATLVKLWNVTGPHPIYSKLNKLDAVPWYEGCADSIVMSAKDLRVELVDGKHLALTVELDVTDEQLLSLIERIGVKTVELGVISYVTHVAAQFQEGDHTYTPKLIKSIGALYLLPHP